MHRLYLEAAHRAIVIADHNYALRAHAPPSNEERPQLDQSLSCTVVFIAPLLSYPRKEHAAQAAPSLERRAEARRSIKWCVRRTSGVESSKHATVVDGGDDQILGGCCCASCGGSDLRLTRSRVERRLETRDAFVDPLGGACAVPPLRAPRAGAARDDRSDAARLLLTCPIGRPANTSSRLLIYVIGPSDTDRRNVPRIQQGVVLATEDVARIFGRLERARAARRPTGLGRQATSPTARPRVSP
jgi:hypothetical protein